MKQMSRTDYKWAIYIAISLILVAVSYLVIVDQLVMVTYQLEWSKLAWLPLMWTVLPAVICVFQALVILISYRPFNGNDYIDPDLKYVQYKGSKFDWL
jgi:heme/copper-type cytochrome/quinol oxidase subunit 2